MTNDGLWTIEELVHRANWLIQQEGLIVPSGRVNSELSLRSVRLYTTLGLLDRPILRGRTGYYSTRHLLQLLAVKRLQAEGLSLVEIQNRLLAMPDEELARIAGVSAEQVKAAYFPPVEEAPRRARAFWRVAEPVRVMEAQPEPVPIQVKRHFTVHLAEGVQLVLEDTGKPITPSLLRAIVRASAPLLRLLEQHGYPHREVHETQKEEDVHANHQRHRVDG